MLQAPEIDLTALRQYRLDRIRDQLRRQDIPLAILVHPVSLRYAVDFREYALFQAHIPMYVLFVPVEGPVVLHGAYNTAYDLVDEYRPSPYFNPFDGGMDLSGRAEQFADDVVEFLAGMGVSGKGTPVAAECLPADVFGALKSRRLRLHNGEALVERARSIKSEEELVSMRHAIAVAEHGMDCMRQALEPGITENRLWSILHQVNIAHDGDWMEGRMLASGPRTNPWLQEATGRVIQAGELVAFDTDMVGPFGYFADVSRTWLCGDGKPSRAQRDIYRHAWEEIQHNISLIEPGIRFAELAAKIYPRRAEFIKHSYPCFAHGAGMSDEYPKLYYPEDGEQQYDGRIEPGMVLCVESFTGSDQGGEGVKLEQMVLVTNSGTEPLTDYPFEDSLLS
jgi:Xaa-Pro aminopeptidase